MDDFEKDEKGTTVGTRGSMLGGMSGVRSQRGKKAPQSMDRASAHFKGDHSKGTKIWQLMP